MTHHVPAELQNYVRQSIIPQYANFDKAHQIDHVEKVIEESLKLATYYEVRCFRKRAYCSSLSISGNETAHIVRYGVK